MSQVFEREKVIRMLSDLKKTDRKFQNFGSEAHNYKLNRPLTKQAVKTFESQHNVELPEDYSYFLTEIGNGGAGPYYGLFPFGDHDRAGAQIGDFSSVFPHKEHWNFPEERWKQWNEESEAEYFASSLVNGSIPICHFGCAIHHLLVICGEERGFVWVDDRASDAGIYPFQESGSERVTFTEWYLLWLNDPQRL